MVLLAPPDNEVRLLPPALPAFLLPKRASSSSFNFRPRADTSASSDASKSQPPSSSSSSACSPSSSGSNNTSRISFPSNRALSYSLGVGAGGAAYFGGSKPALALWPFFGRQRCAGEHDKARKRILIMMSNTGGGHRASAEAIKAGFQEKYGDDYEVLIEDMWKDHCPAPYNKMPDSYSFLVQHSFLWWASYMFMQPRWIHVPYLRLAHMAIGKSLHRSFNNIKPDLVVSVHPLMQHVPIRILKSRVRSGACQPVNFATVVTDFTTCHNTWFHPEATRCFVPTEFCKNLAKSNGLKEEQLIMHGLPIRPIFSKPLPPKKKMKKALGLDSHVPAVLLVGGGEGMGKLEDTVDQMAEKLGGTCQVVVICGRNQKLLERLRAKNYASGMRVVPCGFVNNIHEYMHACDAIVTKAGPGTIAEALISGLPILLNGNVPCQEEGNIPYVIDNAVGAFETRPPVIADILQQWLDPSHREEFEGMATRSKALGRPEAVYKIVDDLARLAHTPDFSFGPAKAAVDCGRVPKAAAA